MKKIIEALAMAAVIAITAGLLLYGMDAHERQVNYYGEPIKEIATCTETN